MLQFIKRNGCEGKSTSHDLFSESGKKLKIPQQTAQEGSPGAAGLNPQ